MIRKFEIKDIESILEIYGYYCLNSIFTFDIQIPEKGTFKKQLLEIQSNYPFYVYEKEGTVVAYAYASKWKNKDAYNKTAEITIYVKDGEHRGGIGYRLYGELLSTMKTNDFHAAIACITLPNHPSVVFHERFGFQKVGHFKEVGFKFYKWIDVGFWQLNF